MISVQIPAFGETEFFDNQMNKTARVVLIPNSPDCRFSEYCRLLKRDGFHQTELVSLPHRRFAAFQKDSTGVFVNFFANTAELQIVVEEDCAYFSYTDIHQRPAHRGVPSGSHPCLSFHHCVVKRVSGGNN